MKKLLTIALALVMVLALAVPAFAIYGWDAAPAATSNKTEGFELTLTGYEYIPATTGFDWMNNYYANWTPTTGIVAGSNVRFVATIDAIANKNMLADVKNDLGSLKLTVSSSNLYIFKADARRFTANDKGVFVIDQSYGTADNSFTKNVLDEVVNKADGSTKFSWKVGDMTTKDYATKVQVMFEASVKSTADANVSATLATGAAFTDGVFTFVKNGKTYVVEHEEDSQYFYVYNKDNKYHVVRFTVDSSNKVIDVHVSLQDNLTQTVLQVKGLTAAEQTTFGGLVDAEYIAQGKVASLYYIAYKAWAEKTAAGIQYLTNVQYWNKTWTATSTDASFYGYANLTTEGKAAFQKVISDNELGLTEPTDKELVNIGKRYMLGLIATDAVYASKLAEIKAVTVLSGATAPAAYAGVYMYEKASELSLLTAVINNVMATKGYVYFINEDNYDHNVYGNLIDADVEDVFLRYGQNYANIYGQVGKLADSETIIAPYYCATYNVNASKLVFGGKTTYLDEGYEKILANDGKDAGTAMYKILHYMCGRIKDGDITHDRLDYVCNNNSRIPTNVFGAANKYVEVYAQIDDIDEQFIVDKAYIVSGSQYTYLKAIFDEITGVLGFNWDNTTSYMYEDAFVANFGSTLSLSKSITYTAYAAQLVVADPNAQPPQTGDASSVLGFVMIALAVVAAGAVVVKKVRA